MSSGGGSGHAGTGSKALDDFIKFEDEDAGKVRMKRDKNGIKRREDLKFEFECPECSANNPVDDGFGDGSEVLCNYCSLEFKVTYVDGGKIKLKTY